MEKGSNKTNKILLILVIILGVLTVGLSVFIATNILVKKTDEVQEEKEEVEVETAIKDIDVITELSTKIDTLLYKSDNQYHQTTSYYGYGYRYGLLKNELTEEDKQFILLNTITWNDMTSSSWEKAKTNENIAALITSYPETYLADSTKEVTEETLNAYSEQLFGAKLTNPKETIGRCPLYFYDSSLNMYYYPEPQCGGITNEMVKTYKSKYEEKGDEAYVYVSFAFLSTTGTNSKLDKYTIYKDFTYSTDLYFGNIAYKDAYQTGYDSSAAENFNIDSTNYEEFSEYKFIFKKDKNNNYYFVKVEQTK